MQQLRQGSARLSSEQMSCADYARLKLQSKVGRARRAGHVTQDGSVAPYQSTYPEPLDNAYRRPQCAGRQRAVHRALQPVHRMASVALPLNIMRAPRARCNTCKHIHLGANRDADVSHGRRIFGDGLNHVSLYVPLSKGTLCLSYAVAHKLQIYMTIRKESREKFEKQGRRLTMHHLQLDNMPSDEKKRNRGMA